MSKLKCAVIGTGYLGKFHAEKYASLPDCELVAVVDINEQAAKDVAEKHDAKALTNYQSLLGKVDAVSIVVPTTLHHQVAKDFLQAGAHVLVEKPVTVTVEEADELIDIAKQKNLVLQVGHLERFNPAVMGLGDLDLMIHDIDIILAIVDSEIDHIEASGTAVLTKGTDIANARLTFKSGCVANVTASRISMKMERKMRMFRPNSYISIDFQNRILTKHYAGDGEMFPGVPKIETDKSVFENGDALLEEIKHFVACIQTGSTPDVSGEAGRRALATAIEITKLLQ